MLFPFVRTAPWKQGAFRCEGSCCFHPCEKDIGGCFRWNPCRGSMSLMRRGCVSSKNSWCISAQWEVSMYSPKTILTHLCLPSPPPPPAQGKKSKYLQPWHNIWGIVRKSLKLLIQTLLNTSYKLYILNKYIHLEGVQVTILQMKKLKPGKIRDDTVIYYKPDLRQSYSLKKFFLICYTRHSRALPPSSHQLLWKPSRGVFIVAHSFWALPRDTEGWNFPGSCEVRCGYATWLGPMNLSRRTMCY